MNLETKSRYPHSRDLPSLPISDLIELWDAVHESNDGAEFLADYRRKCSLYDQSCIKSEFLAWYESGDGYNVYTRAADGSMATFWYKHLLDALDFASQRGNTVGEPLHVFIKSGTPTGFDQEPPNSEDQVYATR